MLCALTVRRLRAGALGEFRRAWNTDSTPPGWRRGSTVRDVEDDEGR